MLAREQSLTHKNHVIPLYHTILSRFKNMLSLYSPETRSRIHIPFLESLIFHFISKKKLGKTMNSLIALCVYYSSDFPMLTVCELFESNLADIQQMEIQNNLEHKIPIYLMNEQKIEWTSQYIIQEIIEGIQIPTKSISFCIIKRNEEFHFI